MNLVSNNTTFQRMGQHRIYTAEGVDSAFRDNILATIDILDNYSDKSQAAVGKLENIIILKDTDSNIPEEFTKTDEKFHSCASDAYGFVSKADNAIVIVEQNHQRKNVSLEGDIVSQGSDTFTHETGHLIDKEFSTSETFKSAYLEDLKNIEKALSDSNSKVCGEDLHQMVEYLHHYMEGVNFDDGIDESDISREGLRENFAECFSTLSDSRPTKINKIYAELFPNTMTATKEFVI